MELLLHYRIATERVCSLACSCGQPTFGKMSQDQGNVSRKRTAATSPATEQTLRTPAVAGASSQDFRNALALGSTCLDNVADVVTKCIQLGSMSEALPGSGVASADVAIRSLSML